MRNRLIPLTLVPLMIVTLHLGLFRLKSPKALAQEGDSEAYILIPMDQSQSDHLRAYGVAYWSLLQDYKVEWLLNYRGGAFLVPDSRILQVQTRLMGVSMEIVSADRREAIFKEMGQGNSEVVLLEKPPKVAIYTPPDKRPWDDAVTLALTYAKVPYDTLWDKEVLEGKLVEYDWLHLHHEDFSGQFGKFYATFHSADWYVKQVEQYRLLAKEAGFDSVQAFKGEIARTIQDYVRSGGFMFAMCSATDTIDIALAAEGIDIVPAEIDGTPQDPDLATRLDFNKTLAFGGFEIIPSAFIYEYSNIDVSQYTNATRPELEDFVLFEFSAKIDPVESMLTQCHTNEIKGFFGQTTSFNREVIKKGVRVLADIPNQNRAKYLHGHLGRGTFTFYGGHDPEDFSHAVGDPPTDLNLHRNSPGYRLILNNILFPAAKKKKLKT